MSSRLPVTFVAGRWGAGKSDVIDRLVPTLPPRSVLLCDGFSEHRHVLADATEVEVLPIEPELLHATRGCPCCAVRTDLVEAIGDLLDRRDPPPHVVVEVVGGSDLAAVAQTFLRTARLRRHARIAGLVTVVDGHAAGTALATHPTGALEGLDLDAVAMADLVVVNRLDRLLPVAEQQTAWMLWSLAGRRQVHLDLPRRRDDPLPRRIRELTGFDLDDRAAAATPRFVDEVIDHADRPLRRLAVHVDGPLDRALLDDWIGDLHRRASHDLLRWRGRFVIAGSDRTWLGHGVRTSVEVADGPPPTGLGTSTVELIGRVPDAAEVLAGLQRAVAA